MFRNCEFGAFICCLVSGVGFRGWKGVIEIWRGWITVSPQYSQNIQQINKITSTSKSCRERYSDVFINLPILYLILLVWFFFLVDFVIAHTCEGKGYIERINTKGEGNDIVLIILCKHGKTHQNKTFSTRHYYYLTFECIRNPLKRGFTFVCLQYILFSILETSE